MLSYITKVYQSCYSNFSLSSIGYFEYTGWASSMVFVLPLIEPSGVGGQLSTGVDGTDAIMIFAYDLSTTVDETGDACCQKAADDDDLATANLVCDRCVEDDTQDEYFTYEAPVCTRRFDRITTCYLSTSVDDEDTVYVDETHCVEEIASCDL